MIEFIKTKLTSTRFLSHLIACVVVTVLLLTGYVDQYIWLYLFGFSTVGYVGSRTASHWAYAYRDRAAPSPVPEVEGLDIKYVEADYSGTRIEG